MSNLAMYPRAPEPSSPLARYRLLSPTAAIKISPLILGSMSFGESWKIMGAYCTKERVFELLDYYYSQGGNAVDTGNMYQEEESEKWIGEWMNSRGVRDEMVIATKYTMMHRRDSGKQIPGSFIAANYQGNGSKSLMLSVESSLRKLNTTYIDILYIHHWDFTTSVPELMRALDCLVRERKVLYLGVSNTPAWIVAKANEYARCHNLAQFCVYSGLWNAASRDLERDVVPMAQDEGMAIVPWGALAEGKFKAATQPPNDAEGRAPFLTILSDSEKSVAAALQKVAESHMTTVTTIALAYLLNKSPYVFPVIGVRTIEQIEGNIEALRIKLSVEDINEIDNSAHFDLGYPHTWLGGPKGATRPEHVVQTINQVICDYVPKPLPIKPLDVVLEDGKGVSKSMNGFH